MEWKVHSLWLCEPPNEYGFMSFMLLICKASEFLGKGEFEKVYSNEFDPNCGWK